jgi:hypothetical protein
MTEFLLLKNSPPKMGPSVSLVNARSRGVGFPGGSSALNTKGISEAGVPVSWWLRRIKQMIQLVASEVETGGTN